MQQITGTNTFNQRPSVTDDVSTQLTAEDLVDLAEFNQENILFKAFLNFIIL